MTKRDYVRIARALNHALNELEIAAENNEPLTARQTLDKVAGFIRIELKADNPRFDEVEFVTAIYAVSVTDPRD